MPLRLVALSEGPDILIDKVMILVGRHPMCDTQLDSIRVSRRHCCMTEVSGELEVKDLGSTNGIQINGHRVVAGRLRPGDELSIAHIRYRLVGGHGQEMTLEDPISLVHSEGDRSHAPFHGPLADRQPAGGSHMQPADLSPGQQMQDSDEVRAQRAIGGRARLESLSTADSTWCIPAVGSSLLRSDRIIGHVPHVGSFLLKTSPGRTSTWSTSPSRRPEQVGQNFSVPRPPSPIDPGGDQGIRGLVNPRKSP